MKKKSPGKEHIAQNRKARFEYTLEEYFEAGLCLQGWEVKSLREGKGQISDSHVIVKRGEAWLVGSVFTPLKTVSTHFLPEPNRTRKLLLNRKELNRLIGQVERKGYTLVPISLHWKRNHIKLDLALGKGKKLYDKRHAIKEREWQRSKSRLLK